MMYTFVLKHCDTLEMIHRYLEIHVNDTNNELDIVM